MYWTDTPQARDRVENSFVMLGNDPVYIRAIDGSQATIDNTRTGERSVIKKLTDFGDFRALPPMGWVNLLLVGIPKAVYLARRPIRGRKHGVTGDGTIVYSFNNDVLSGGREFMFSDVMHDKGYIATVDNDYPSYQEVFDNTPIGCGVAFSRSLLIYHDTSGMRWLYRHRERIGFVEKTTIKVFDNKTFYREALEAAGLSVTIQ